MRLAPLLQRIGNRGDEVELVDLATGMLTRADRLMAPGLDASVSDEYMSSHWVATFAWEALDHCTNAS